MLITLILRIDSINLVADIKALNLANATNFTSYPEGSPTHPSYPAMHSAGSAASFWLAVVLDLIEEQWCQVKLLENQLSGVWLL